MIVNNDFHEQIWKQTQLTRETFDLSVCILFLVAKASDDIRFGSATLATETVVLPPLRDGWWGQGIARVLYDKIKKYTTIQKYLERTLKIFYFSF